MSQEYQAPTLQFIGAAQTVTGSKTLLSFRGKKVLIDCGLFQGPRQIREKNWDVFKGAEEVDAVILTHAHVDHSGYLPKIVNDGFRGQVFCTEGTRDLCEIMLRDSAHLQEEDARFANRTKHSRHNPAKPLYTARDAEQALSLFAPLEKSEWHELYPGISVKFVRAGHILGSAIVQLNLQHDHKSIIVTFSGDLGNGRQHVIKQPEQILETDFLIMEGTYGDRAQPRTDPSDILQHLIQKVHQSQGVLVIPSFAVGRTQEILYLLRRLEVEGKIPKIPVYLDSPMATEATEIYLRHKDELKLDIEKGGVVEPIRSSLFEVTRSTDDSMLLCMKDGPFVVLSAAGMLTGGRVLHHLKARLPRPENIVLFVGWQAEETKGRLLKQGLPKIRIHKTEIDIEAEIAAIDSLSAHADTQDIIEWISNIENGPKKVFLNHGEKSALNALKYRLRYELDLDVEIPEEGEVVELELNL